MGDRTARIFGYRGRFGVSKEDGKESINLHAFGAYSYTKDTLLAANFINLNYEGEINWYIWFALI